jgi:rubrerythrin
MFGTSEGDPNVGEVHSANIILKKLFRFIFARERSHWARFRRSSVVPFLTPLSFLCPVTAERREIAMSPEDIASSSFL